MTHMAHVISGKVSHSRTSPGLRLLALAAILMLGSRHALADGPSELAGLHALYPSLDSLYIDLHKNPELSLHEEKTASKLAARLRSLGSASGPGRRAGDGARRRIWRRRGPEKRYGPDRLGPHRHGRSPH